MQFRCDGSEIATILNEFNRSLQGKKTLISRRLSKKPVPIRKSCGATAKKSDRKACVIMHVQSVQGNREFKQIATATSTTAVVDAVSWGEYVS